MIRYLDESGDLVFSEESGNHFTIEFLVSETETSLKRQVKRVKERFVRRDVVRRDVFDYVES